MYKIKKSRSKNRVRGSSPMSRTPSPAVSVITISSESADDNRKVGNNNNGNVNQTAQGGTVPRNGGHAASSRLTHPTASAAGEHYESPPPGAASGTNGQLPAPIANGRTGNGRTGSPGFTQLPINENHVTSTSNNQRNNHRGVDYEV